MANFNSNQRKNPLNSVTSKRVTSYHQLLNREVLMLFSYKIEDILQETINKYLTIITDFWVQENNNQLNKESRFLNLESQENNSRKQDKSQTNQGEIDLFVSNLRRLIANEITEKAKEKICQVDTYVNLKPQGILAKALEKSQIKMSFSAQTSCSMAINLYQEAIQVNCRRAKDDSWEILASEKLSSLKKK